MPTITRLDAIEVFTDFLASHPTDEEVLDFRFPLEIEARVQALVTKNNAGTITEGELRELEEYERLDTYGGLLKAKIMQHRHRAGADQ
ncbi:MAG: hypothetical protein MAG451_01099 [Anaerolineales bacterium]|nr:hypothetical protein [Anaerolineales bacterium]